MISHILVFLSSAALMLMLSQTVTSNEVEPNAKCTTPGFMCKNCNMVAACIQDPSGILTQMDIARCPGSCRDGSCKTGAICNWRPFTCSLGETGPFPDPYDCTKFHICDGKSTTPISKTCPLDIITGRPSAYGSETGSCRYPVAGNPKCIDNPMPRCKNNLEVGVLHYDPSIFYICTESNGGNNVTSLAPDVHKCLPGTGFNSSTFVCS